ncbi:MAG TPA: LemA family protein [Verrucomicrobiae bacterium]|nr:LemA family protein [Verrucomicrobiae bacterium]
MILGLLVVVALFFAMLLWVVSVYNNLVTLRNLVDSAWAQTDVQLRRRYDLIPNLVETVKGYATHERETFEKVTQARNTAMNATTPDAKAGAENALTGALKSVFAVAEAYPELKANQNFTALQQELTNTEGFIAECRSHYNDAVLTLNTALQVFPASAVANLFSFQAHEYFGVPDAVAREPVKVQF